MFIRLWLDFGTLLVDIFSIRR